MHAWDETTEDGNAQTEEEDFFPSDYLEVEQILACEERKMDLKVFAWQRALNLQHALFGIDDHNQGKKITTVDLGKGSIGRNKSVSISENIDHSDESSDPEDYVRYVFKWKGMKASEVTLGYCKDIKQDYMDAAEDFWQQHCPPTAEEVTSISEWQHPHVRYFKKLSVLPSFGESKVKIPVAVFGKHLSTEVTEASSSSNNGEDDN